MIAAQNLCENNGLDFHLVFDRQYCLSKAALPKVDGWHQTGPRLGWELAHCPKLECQDILGKTGTLLGWFLGTAVNQIGKVVDERALTLSTDPSEADFWDQVERYISTLAGRYIAIILTNGEKRIYADPVMDLPVVFNAKEKLVGSSPLMALSRPVRINHRIHHKVINERGGNYGLQQTCDPDVIRGLSNHFLDLDSFALRRHWPKENETFNHQSNNIVETAEFVVARLGQIAQALLQNFKCSLPLSGGADSRTLAFSAKENIHLAKCYSHRTNWITGLDCFSGSLIAKELGNELRIIDALGTLQRGDIPLGEIRRLRWNFRHRTGYQKPLTDAELVACDLVEEADFVLRGNILEIARANQWPRNLQFSIEHAISKLDIGGRPPEESITYWEPEYWNWFSTLPPLARPCAYEFAFLEQLLPNTLGGRLIGCGRAAYINPFNDRSLIKACMTVHPKIRKSGKFNKALHIACGAPDIPSISDIKASAELKQCARELFAA